VNEVKRRGGITISALTFMLGSMRDAGAGESVRVSGILEVEHRAVRV